MGQALSLLDLDLLRLVHLHGAPVWVVDAFVALSFLGSGWMLLALLPLLALGGWRRLAAWSLGVAVVTAAIVALLKTLVGRVRPCNALSWCAAIAVHAPADYSFPSGHAAGSFAIAAFIWGLDRRFGAAALAWAALVATSRVALGVHYPTDVLAGALLGSTVGALAAYRFTHRPPAPAPFAAAPPPRRMHSQP